MKGLLLKDFYMLIKYCKMYLLITSIFIIIFIIGEDNLFFGFYPCLLAGMIPVTLLAYDERSRWDMYCKVLPYTETEVVSAKYIVGLLCQVFVLIMTGIAFAVRMLIAKEFGLDNYLYFLLMIQTVSCATSSVILPLLFRFGVEKGRIAYFVMIGIILAGAVAAASLIRMNGEGKAALTWGILFMFIAAALVYVLSWRLSVIFYKKREA